MRFILNTILPLTLLASCSVSAGEKYNHFPSLPAPDPETAICNLTKFNAKLAEITNKKQITPEDMVKVHELTYTLENAVAQLQSTLEVTAVELEKVHKASERMDQNVVKTSGDIYLTKLQAILSSPSCK